MKLPELTESEYQLMLRALDHFRVDSAKLAINLGETQGLRSIGKALHDVARDCASLTAKLENGTHD
jgi:hypothetical protein